MTAPIRCAGCGSAGRLPTIAAPKDDPQPILSIAWTKDGPRLVCAICRADEVQ
jgi:hypothetical protein